MFRLGGTLTGQHDVNCSETRPLPFLLVANLTRIEAAKDWTYFPIYFNRIRFLFFLLLDGHPSSQ